MSAAADALHAAVQAFIADHADFPAATDAARFDALAVALATHQAAHHRGHARLHARRGAPLRVAADVPAVPTDVFKATRVATFPEELEIARFRTSGTTVGARGAHSFRTLTTYDAGALAAGRHALLRGWPQGPVPVLVLGPSPEEVGDSSLGHMNALFAERFGAPASAEETFFLRRDALAVDALKARVRALRASGERRLLLLGTSFSFVHLLDALAGAGLPLPPEARVMQTGGFKGKSREVDGPTLRRDLAAAFAIPARAIVLEYGMTELSSQCWEWTAVAADEPLGLLHPPPWQRVVAVDPDTLAPLPPGVEGIARVEDLANVESAFAVQTQDLVTVRPDGAFTLRGRLPGATPRGCSIATDELLAL